MKGAVSILLFYFVFGLEGSKANAPDDPELIERSLATTNMLGFPEELLLDALFPNDVEPSKHSAEELFKALSSGEGQEAARVAAMRSMLSNPRARGTDGWLGGMCDAMPWLSWLLRCTSSDEEGGGVENREEPPQEPNTLVIREYVYAKCDFSAGDYSEEDNSLGRK
ncbi:uncharacterized protein LOC132197365 [Neocloeon triangulifer]|uniref:uncharacterized protein LOC132197365 n=1 Tax=Neocloeon triangulifer TaxID=2078957 RepID=UPI00286F8D63|nr:uncharacterized protein LOC132197365 [Neocloeon triangulifer]